ncbi:MAG: hypothetical protein IJB94_04910 [Clostridia bacterium]|nr:hypothetical protein [Clostridia bacterium]
MEKVIDTLLKEYIADYINKKDYSFVVQDSVPIVWFGNIDAYDQSPTRILTIGLNPSKEEFPKHAPPRFDRIDVELLKSSTDFLANTLNNYFEKNPYIKWFSKYNKLLSSLDASYGGVFGKKENTALHIDIYSAIATDPTWGKLSDIQKYRLENSNLFNKLFLVLDPDIILISVNRPIFKKHFCKWELTSEKHFGDSNYIELYNKDNKKLIFGRNYNGIPFGGIKENLAKNAIKDFIDQ